MSAIVEVDQVSNVATNPDGAGVELDPAARIERSIYVVSAKRIDGTRERAKGRGTRIQPEIYESSLDRTECSNRSRPMEHPCRQLQC